MSSNNRNSHDQISKLISLWKNHGQGGELDEQSLEALRWSRYATTYAPGPCYYFLFNLDMWKMEYVHHTVQDILGISAQEFTVDELLSRHHPEDFERFQLLEKAAADFYNNHIDKEDITRYKASYLNRLRHSNGQYKWVLHQMRPLIINKEGRITRSIGIHSDVSHLNLPYNNRISFIGFGRPSYLNLDPKQLNLEKAKEKAKFTEKELEIIRLMANGLSGPGIAAKIGISEHTVKSYKKIILRKAEASNAVNLVAKCIREGII